MSPTDLHNKPPLDILNLDRESLASLIILEALSADQVNRLYAAQVGSCGDLVWQVRDDFARARLHSRTAIPNEQLLLAGATANLLQMHGPGSMAAARILENSRSSVDLEDGKALENLEDWLHANRSKTFSLLARHVEEAKAKARIESRIWWQKWYPLVFFGVVMLWPIAGEWSRLFPPAAESSFDQAVSAFQRNLALSYLAAFAITFGLLALGLYVFMWAVKPSAYGRVSVFLGRVLLSDRDTVLLWETGQIASESYERRLQSIQRAWNWLPLIAVGVGFGGALLQLEDRIVMGLVGAAFIVGISALTALELFVRHKGFTRWNAAWAEQVRLHYTGHTIVTSVLQVGVIGLTFALALLVAVEVGVWLAVPWSGHVAENGKTGFLAALPASDLAAEDWSMAQAWAQRQAAGLQQNIATVGAEAQSVVVEALDALLVGIILELVVFTTLAFVSGMRRKGLIALLVPLILWLGGELIPDTVGQISAGQSPFVKLSLTALAVSLVIAILSNILGERAAQRDERECQKCYLLAAKDDNFCKTCGTPLVSSAVTMRSR